MLLSDLRILVLAEHGINQAELGSTREKLERAGVKVVVASAEMPEVKSWSRGGWGNRIKVDQKISVVSADKYQGLLIPGGPFHADKLRTDDGAIALAKQFFASGKIIGAIGHGIQLLIDAAVIAGRQVTSSPSIKADVVSAGGIWKEEGTVVDNGLVTCRCENDVEKFNDAFLEELRHGISQRTETII